MCITIIIIVTIIIVIIIITPDTRNMGKMRARATWITCLVRGGYSSFLYPTIRSYHLLPGPAAERYDEPPDHAAHTLHHQHHRQHHTQPGHQVIL